MPLENPNWHDPLYDSVHFLLSACYIVLTVGAIVPLIRVLITKSSANWQKAFHVVYILGALTRAVCMSLQPLIREKIILITNSSNFILYTIPTFLFFSTYMILLLIWGEIYSAHEDKMSINLSGNKQPFVIIINVIMYSVLVVLYTLDFVHTPTTYKSISTAETVYEKAIIVFGSALYICTSVAFFVYFYSLFVNMLDNQSLPRRSSRSRKLLRRVGIVTIMCIMCYLCRAGLVLINIFEVQDEDFWWLDGVYYFLLEIVPQSLMLYVLNYQPKKAHPINNAPLGPTSPLLISRSG